MCVEGAASIDYRFSHGTIISFPRSWLEKAAANLSRYSAVIRCIHTLFPSPLQYPHCVRMPSGSFPDPLDHGVVKVVFSQRCMTSLVVESCVRRVYQECRSRHILRSVNCRITEDERMQVDLVRFEVQEPCRNFPNKGAVCIVFDAIFCLSAKSQQTVVGW